MPTYITEFKAPAIVLLVILAIIGWLMGRAGVRATVLVLAYVTICGVAFSLAAPDERWDVLVSIATALAVITALFTAEIHKLVYRATVTVKVDDDLIDSAHGSLWIRGRITNSGDRNIERCRIKLLRIEGQESRIENGYLQWQSGIHEPLSLGSEEHLIFDIATRPPVEGSSVELMAYIVNHQQLTHPLNSGQTYTLQLAIYGDNIPTKMHTVRLRIGVVAEDIEFL